MGKLEEATRTINEQNMMIAKLQGTIDHQKILIIGADNLIHQLTEKLEEATKLVHELADENEYLHLKLGIIDNVINGEVITGEGIEDEN